MHREDNLRDPGSGSQIPVFPPKADYRTGKTTNARESQIKNTVT